uniref:Uncharacterized protein n=1 Tax=Arundo donax TaxID=35708 RepID=A0A0A9GMY6_ARUDO
MYQKAVVLLSLYHATICCMTASHFYIVVAPMIEHFFMLSSKSSFNDSRITLAIIEADSWEWSNRSEGAQQV